MIPAGQHTDVDPVVDQTWVAQRLESIVLADVRWYLDGRSGHDAYLEGHLPGAIWIDLDTVLSDDPSSSGGRHPLPDAKALARSLGRLGIAGKDIVVGYDDQGGGFAARLVWMLRVIGQPAALLDGGLNKWAGPLETGAVKREPVGRRARPWPNERLRSADATLAAAASPHAVVLDARAAARYAGDEALTGETRVGHVPGALSAPWSANLRDDESFRAPDELRERFTQLGVGTAEEVVVYCGSGVTACHNLLALERAGLAPGSLFVGSWSAWSADAARPVAGGPFPSGVATPAREVGVPTHSHGEDEHQ